MKWQTKHNDPFSDRESEKYPNPIPSREYILNWLHKRGQPATKEQLVSELYLLEPEQKEALFRRLTAMERDGQLIRNRKGDYGLIDKMNLVRGTLIGHPEGFGFVISDDKTAEVFLSPREMRSLLHEDRVIVRISGSSKKGKKEGSLVDVLERKVKRVVGRYFIEGGVGFVEPDNKRIHQDILIPLECAQNAQSGQIVVAEITAYPTKRTLPIGKIIEILGDKALPGMEIDISIRSHNIPYEWQEAAKTAVQKLPQKITRHDLKNRTDLRKLPFVTIDGADAKDFDDAIYCEEDKKGDWTLYVAIADVSYYVKPQDELDQEALTRGNSTYFPERVIPMLPEELSNHLCSLKPQVDRLCLVSELKINKKGERTAYRFYPAVICSKARLTYEEVDRLQKDPKSTTHAYKALWPHLKAAYALEHKLLERRKERGALEFDTIETKIKFGKNHKIENIVPIARLGSHRLIEECMLAANVAAADFLKKHNVPTLYRIHPDPEATKLTQLQTFLKEFELKLDGGKKPSPLAYQKLIEQIEGRTDQHVIQIMLLRSLNQAVYSPVASPHFGLAYKIYTHFTSPIRRYPDLLVHRAIYHVLQKGVDGNFHYSKNDMIRFGEHCSMTERRSDDATRDALYRFKCEYMLEKVGEEFNGTISSVTGFGLFVELDKLLVDGLVHVSSLKKDYYRFDPKRQRLQGERTGHTYHLGERVRVKVSRIDLEARKIDFELVGKYASHRQ
ncbi:MAG: ribonuclease R [Gammaproteobacteria bacterium]|nr:ribonuclease R [Gammaproteobacteria bacterium]